jgi:hypothetical protein
MRISFELLEGFLAGRGTQVILDTLVRFSLFQMSEALLESYINANFKIEGPCLLSYVPNLLPL